MDEVQADPVKLPHSARRRWLTRVAITSGISFCIGFVALYAYATTVKPKHGAEQFASAWTTGHLESIKYAGITGAEVKREYDQYVGSLGTRPVAVKATSVKHGVATFHVSWDLGSGKYEYDTRAPVKRKGGTWRVAWSPRTIHPELAGAGHLAVQRVEPDRADIEGTNHEPLVTARPTVEVGVVPQRVTNVDQLSKQLGDLLDVNATALAAQIRSAKPDAFVSVITLRRPDYDNLKGQLQPLAGTSFHEGMLPLAPTRQYASALLGRTGAVTAEIGEKSKGRYENGDIAGLSGLEQQYDERLRGQVGYTVQLVSPGGDDPEALFTLQPKTGDALQTTIDARTQTAAETAIGGATKPTSLVAMKVSSGEVVAVANGPEVGGLDRALEGQYPPGSSFKVVTTAALLQKGVQPSDNVPCPPTTTVNGKEFKNAEDEAFASAPFGTDFAKSCNTAFISLASRLQNDTLATTASAFGLGGKWSIGPSAFTGSVPAASDDVDRAAEMIGQGRILASPLAMANVAATVARNGKFAQPSLVASADAPATEPGIDQPIAGTLQSLMRDVVTSGTGTAAAHVPGQPVFGKTGTAEFGNDNPPKAHAWFIGYQGDIAFAAFVEGGEFGGDAAAPIAAKFLSELSKAPE